MINLNQHTKMQFLRPVYQRRSLRLGRRIGDISSVSESNLSDLQVNNISIQKSNCANCVKLNKTFINANKENTYHPNIQKPFIEDESAKKPV